MKKSLLAVGLSLSMMLAMATPAFAAISTDTNLNADGAAVTAPGVPGTAQTAGESFNAANISGDGTKWETVNDDDAVLKATDTAADINVWAKVVDTNTRVYKVDLAWGAMKFEYKNTSGTWNTTTHTYTGGTAEHGWTEATFLDGTNNKVAVTNHSNNGIDAAFAYAMDATTKFNDNIGKDNVVGNFFDTNPPAVTAAKVLVGTYDASGLNEQHNVILNQLAGPVKLATADAYNDGTTDQLAGARTDDVFFAFSGTPDAGKGAVTLSNFTKVGVITVTVTPNNDPTLN